MNSTQVQVEGSFNSDTGTVNLRVTDAKSATPIMDLELSAADWLALSSGSSRTMNAWLTSNYDRVGKHLKVRTVNVPAWVVTQAKIDKAEAVRKWGEGQAQPGEIVEPRNTNTGWQVILRRWETE